MAETDLIYKALRKNVLDSAAEFVHASDDYTGSSADAEMALCELVDAVMAYHEYCKPKIACSNDDKEMMTLFESIIGNADSIDIVAMDGKTAPEFRDPGKSPLREVFKSLCEKEAESEIFASGKNKDYKPRKKHKTAKSGKHKK